MSGLRITSLKFDDTGIFEPTIARALCNVAHRDCGDLDAAPGTPRDFVLIALQNFVGSAADGAQAQQTDLGLVSQTQVSRTRQRAGNR